MVACNEPGPTELEREDPDEKLDIELLSPDPNILPGNYDSTGTVQQVPKYANIISVNGIKNTFNNNTQKDFYASAEFYDRSDSIKTFNGRLLGFRLRALGRVNFADKLARLVSKRIRFLQSGSIADTSLGFFHELKSWGQGPGPGAGGPNQRIDFPYNSNIKFELLSVLGENAIADIPTPAEITGRLRVLGSQAENNLRLELNWDVLSDDRIDIVVGGVNELRREHVPFYRIKNVRNDGRLIIPKELMKNIPFQEFNTLVVSFERIKQSFFSNSTLSDNLIMSKSIHNIRFNVP
jgi:hypothetical protein